MAKKDIDIYYKEICNQYQEMLNEIKDFEEEAKKGLIEPERLDKIKLSIQPLMNNYERWSYMMFLLNKPVKKNKVSKYVNQNKKSLKTLNNNVKPDNIIKENQEVINELKTLIK